MTVVASERGFTLAETLLGVLIAGFGLVSTVSAFGPASNTQQTASRNELATNYAQQELERMRALDYQQLALKDGSIPEDTGSGKVICGWGCWLRVRDGAALELIAISTDGSGQVEPKQGFSVKVGDATQTGTVYRYVSWRDENCTAAVEAGELCASSFVDTKRLTVAVALDPPNAAGHGPGPREPVWVSTVVVDRDAAPPGYSPPAEPVEASVQAFHLTSTACATAARSPAVPQAAQTRTTALTGAGGAANANLRCDVGDESGRPDLLSSTPASDGAAAPPDFSTELSGSGYANYTGGLLMRKRTDRCDTAGWNTYASVAGGEHQLVHAWTTNKLNSAFQIEKTVALSLHAAMPDNAVGNGVVCAALYASEASGADVLLGATDPDTPCGAEMTDAGATERILCGFELSASSPLGAVGADGKPHWTVSGGSRLTLVVAVSADSDDDLALRYDNAAFDSFVQVLTTTPCSGGGSPC